ncbi:hypothetical protein MB46_07300 [Arthrobacter alpinus]|uniref:hypothetical protein n=1 Tax=Arthrobacter alpinus TaxID=656366 RepID=UPI0006784C3D|nr:hypothetical protein [Arthrobacter alpinus]ALV45326.1 hypothetical protein MB46_07300 [Arthrobacter alpinus]
MDDESLTPEITPPAQASEPAPSKAHPTVTRASMMWVATAAGLLVFVLLISFILQNQESVTLHYFGLNGTVSVGVPLRASPSTSLPSMFESDPTVSRPAYGAVRLQWLQSVIF